MRTKPFIYMFTTPRYKYLYDFNTNAILRVSEDVYRDLEKWLISGNLENSTPLTRINIEELIEKGFLQSRKWIDIEHPATSLLSQYLKGSIETLTLQVTQQCNLRCKYCPYSGTYYNREHNKKKMSFETAKKAIDFYIKHSYDLSILNISFYGGEPLLEFSLIKKIVEYVKDKSFGKEIRFRMTTNATLLNEEIINFLVENDFHITISLDGPKDLHDKNRKNMHDKGTFDIIIRNIEKINQLHKDYIKNILFNCVIDPSGDFGCLSDFFTNFNVVKDYMTNFSTISREGIKDEESFLPDNMYIENYNYEMFKLLLSKIDKLDKKYVSKIVQAYYSHLMNVLAERNIAVSNAEISHPGGPCIPGSHKLFVDIYGEFYPCEKLNECSNDLIIGDLENGFNLRKVEAILNVGKLTKNECENCWCSKFCYLCVLYSEDGKKLSKQKRKSHCASVKKETESLFRDYCLIKEMNSFDETIYFF